MRMVTAIGGKIVSLDDLAVSLVGLDSEQFAYVIKEMHRVAKVDADDLATPGIVETLEAIGFKVLTEEDLAQALYLGDEDFPHALTEDDGAPAPEG